MEDERTFTDRTGIRWTVTEVRGAHAVPPMRERRKFVRAATRTQGKHSITPARDHALGWLRFESRGDSRRLDEVPSDWMALSDGELEDLLGKSRRRD